MVLLPDSHSLTLPDKAEAFGLHLNRWPWEWYTTLTFRSRVSEQSANYALWQLNRHLRKSQGFSPGFLWVTEWQERRHVPHFHGLLLNVAGLRRLDVKDYWERYGHARVEAFDPMRGANYYVGKYLFKTAGMVQVSRNLDRWRLDLSDPTTQALARVFDVGQGEQPLSYTAEAEPYGSPVPVLAAATGK